MAPERQSVRVPPRITGVWEALCSDGKPGPAVEPDEPYPDSVDRILTQGLDEREGPGGSGSPVYGRGRHRHFAAPDLFPG